MKIKLRQYSFALLATFIVNLASIGHVSAMPVGAHHMDGGSGATNCATVCLSAPTGKQKYDDVQLKDEDDQPDEPYYARFVALDIYSYTNMHTPQQPDLSGGPPAYRLCCVIRR